MGRASCFFAARFGVAALAIRGPLPLSTSCGSMGANAEPRNGCRPGSIDRYEGGHPPAAVPFGEGGARVAEAAHERAADIAAAAVGEGAADPRRGSPVAIDGDHVPAQAGDEAAGIG